jgi:hypothetical protein
MQLELFDAVFDSLYILFSEKIVLYYMSKSDFQNQIPLKMEFFYYFYNLLLLST